jgi:hypothetical protein
MLKKPFFALIVLVFFIIPTTVSAYSPLGPKWPSGSINYKWGSNLQTSGSVIRTAFEQATSDWTATPTRIIFSYNSSSVNTLNSYYLVDSSDYGVCNYSYTGSTFNNFTAMVNAGNSNVTTTNVARSAAGHELGHGLGLDHTIASALMNSSRDRTIIYVPTADDVAGANSVYP